MEIITVLSVTGTYVAYQWILLSKLFSRTWVLYGYSWTRKYRKYSQVRKKLFLNCIQIYVLSRRKVFPNTIWIAEVIFLFKVKIEHPLGSGWSYILGCINEKILVNYIFNLRISLKNPVKNENLSDTSILITWEVFAKPPTILNFY